MCFKCASRWVAFLGSGGCAVGAKVNEWLGQYLKAEATYQWYNYGLTKVPVGRTPLRINVDESAVCLYHCGRAGNVFLPKGNPAVENVPLGMRRRYVSHIASSYLPRRCQYQQHIGMC